MYASAAIKFQRMTPIVLSAPPVIALVGVKPVLDIVVEKEYAYFRIERTGLTSSLCTVHYDLTSANVGDLSGTVSGDVSFASGQTLALVKVLTNKAASPVGPRLITCTLTAVTNCQVNSTLPVATTNLVNYVDNSAKWWKSLTYRSTQPMAMGINSWVNPPLAWTDYEDATTGVNYVDSFAGNHFGASLERIATWAMVQGGPDNSTTISSTGQFSWASIDGQFSKPFYGVPANAAWAVFLFAIFPTALRTDTGDHAAAWDEINAGTDDQRFKDMGGRIAALCTARGISLSKFICVPCPSPQTTGVPFQIYAATRDKYRQAMERIAGLIRTGASFPNLRFAWCPAQNRQVLGEDFGSLADWRPAGYDAIGMSFRPDSQIFDRNSYDQWIAGSSSYYGLVGDLVDLSNDTGLPILIHNWGPRWQDCPIADQVYQWFYDEYLVPYAPRLVTACVFHNNTIIKTAAAAQGEPGNTAWSNGVDVFKGRWGRGGSPPPPPFTLLPDDVSTTQDQPIVINVLANDTGDSLTASLETPPANGTVALASNKFTYTPTHAFYGIDTFYYRATDRVGQTGTAQVTVRVNAIPVVANPDAVAAQSGVTQRISVLANDVGDNIVITGVGTPNHGGVAVRVNANTQIDYTPSATFVGTEAFTYNISDGNTASSSTVTATVTATVSPLVCVDDSGSTTGTNLLTINVLTNDTGTGLRVTAVTVPANGTSAIGTGGNVTYKANSGFAGSDSFTYTVTDSVGRTASATVRVTVTRVALNANNDAVTVTAGVLTSLDVLANDTGTGITITAVTAPNHAGVVAIASDKKSLNYTPASAYRGAETFNYTISDGVNTDTAAVNATVQAPAALTYFDFPFSKIAACNRAMGVITADDFGIPAGSPGRKGGATDAVPGSRGTLYRAVNGNLDTVQWFMKYFAQVKSSYTAYDFYSNASPDNGYPPNTLYLTLKAPPSWLTGFSDTSNTGFDRVGTIFDPGTGLCHTFYNLNYNSGTQRFRARSHRVWRLDGDDVPGSDSYDNGVDAIRWRAPAAFLRLAEVLKIRSAADITAYPLKHALECAATAYHSNPAPDVFHILGPSMVWPAKSTDGTNDLNAGNIPYGTLTTIRNEDLGAINSTTGSPFTGYLDPNLPAGTPAPQYTLNLDPIGKWLFNGIVDHGLYMADATGSPTDSAGKLLIRVTQEDETNWNSWQLTGITNFVSNINTQLRKLFPLLWPLLTTRPYSGQAAYQWTDGLYYTTKNGPRRSTAINYALDV